jgi:hypothetical protein
VYHHVLVPISYIHSHWEVIMGTGFALQPSVWTFAGWKKMTSTNVYIIQYNNAHKAFKINIFIG